MEHKKDMGKLINEYEMTRIPEEGIERMEAKINQAKMDKKRAKRKKRMRNIGVGAAAALGLMFVLPNVNGNIAYAMGNLPVVGNVFKVITVRDYEWVDNNGQRELKVTVPEIAEETEGTEKSKASGQVNKSVKEYTDELMAKFEADRKETGEGHQGLDVSYSVLTDTDKWFSLDIAAVETQASGYEYHKFYTVNKETDQIVSLKDLFTDGADYITPISEEIIRQMKEEPGVYWLGDGDENEEDIFKAIKPDQNFYIKEDGTLVIAFDEYEVGPGYIGAPQFEIPPEVISGILK